MRSVGVSPETPERWKCTSQIRGLLLVASLPERIPGPWENPKGKLAAAVFRRIRRLSIMPAQRLVFRHAGSAKDPFHPSHLIIHLDKPKTLGHLPDGDLRIIRPEDATVLIFVVAKAYL